MTDSKSTSAIETSSLGKTYRGRNESPTHALVQVSFSIPEAQFVGVVGAPGAGKTTLLKLIGCTLRPTTGRANLFGYDVIRQPWDARALVRLTSNDARAIHRRSTMRETVLASLVPAGRGVSDVESRASRILDRLGLAEGTRISSWPGSAWTWIRLSLAVALVSDPKVVLLDEPTTGLDDTDARSLMRMLADLGRAAGKTVVVATGQVGLVREYCDRVIVLDRGRVAFDCHAPDLRRIRLADVYQITVGGQLDDTWSDWFDGMRIATTDAGATILTGPVPDQSALHGLLTKVRDLGLPLLALCRVEPDARDVLHQLGGSGGRIEDARRLSRSGRLG